MTDNDKNEFDIHDEDELAEIHRFDFGRAVGLMAIAEKVATVAPKCTSLLGIAQAELEAMNEQAKDIARRRAEKAKAMEQRRFEAEQAKQREDAERAERENNPDDNRPVRRAIPSASIPANPQPAPPPGPGEPSPTRRL